MKQQLGDTARHFWLTRSVARVLGLNLSEEIWAGHLTEEDYSDMVTRCRGCAAMEDCQEWLSQQQDLAHAPMKGCCNENVLKWLQQRH